MVQFRDMPIPDDARHVRVELSVADINSLKEVAREAGDVALSAVARVGLSLIAQGVFDKQTVVLAIRDILAVTAPPKEPKPRRPRGRPPKAKEAEAPPEPKKKKRGRPKKEEGDG